MNTGTPIPPNTGEKLNEATDKIAGAASKAWETTREKAGEALHTGERYVRENPGASMLAIFGFGFLLGMLVGWSVAHEEQDDYADSARRFARRWRKKLNLD